MRVVPGIRDVFRGVLRQLPVAVVEDGVSDILELCRLIGLCCGLRWGKVGGYRVKAICGTAIVVFIRILVESACGGFVDVFCCGLLHGEGVNSRVNLLNLQLVREKGGKLSEKDPG